MTIVTIQKTEYKKLKRYSAAYLKIVKEIAGAEREFAREFAYDYRYIQKLTKEAKIAHKKGQTIEGVSIKDALVKFRKQ